MATEQRRVEFGSITRYRGLVFEKLALASSVLGIAALAVLLTMVVIDAFDLANASHAWVLTGVATVVGPVAALWLYSADDPRLTRRALAAYAFGLPASYLGFEVLQLAALQLADARIGRLSWSLVYLFAVVVPTTSVVVYAGTQEPIGATASGMLGRLCGGAALGIGLALLFAVYDAELWVFAYTLGLLPAAGVWALGRLHASRWLRRLSVAVAAIGITAGVFLGRVVVIFLDDWILFAWSIVVPVAAVLAFVVGRDRGRTTGAILGATSTLVPVGGALTATAVGWSPRLTMLALVPATAITGVYVLRVLESNHGVPGLVAPILLVGGVVAGWIVVTVAGVGAPDPWLDTQYVWKSPSSTPRDAGIFPGLVGSVLIIAIVAVMSFALGVGTALFLEEYTAGTGMVGTITRIVQVNIANLAAVPSVVYGLLGLGLFANLLGLGYGSVLTAAITLSLLILPITIISAQEAIRAVPDDLRQGSYAMGSTRWQTTKNVVLPEALPGILTGTILALGRAIGETAPLIMIGVAHSTWSPPSGITGSASAMPMQIYSWSARPLADFRYGVLAAGVVSLLVVLLCMNATAIVLRNRYERGDV